MSNSAQTKYKRFFMSEQFPPLQEFIITKWDSFSSFANDINHNSPLFIEGEGVLYLQKMMNNFLFKDTFYLFALNDRLFCSAVKEDRETRKRFFDGVYEVMPGLLKSSLFREAQQANFNTKFKSLGTKIEIECKPYEYHDEHKLLFSTAGKVDLLYSHQIHIKNNELNFKAQVYPSLQQTAQWQKMRDKVHEKTQAYLDSKKKNA